jgi:hypothetical protein
VFQQGLVRRIHMPFVQISLSPNEETYGLCDCLSSYKFSINS